MKKTTVQACFLMVQGCAFAFILYVPGAAPVAAVIVALCPLAAAILS